MWYPRITFPRNSEVIDQICNVYQSYKEVAKLHTPSTQQKKQRNMQLSHSAPCLHSAWAGDLMNNVYTARSALQTTRLTHLSQPLKEVRLHWPVGLLHQRSAVETLQYSNISKSTADTQATLCTLCTSHRRQCRPGLSLILPSTTESHIFTFTLNNQQAIITQIMFICYMLIQCSKATTLY